MALAVAAVAGISVQATRSIDKRMTLSLFACAMHLQHHLIESYENNRCTFICAVHLEDASPYWGITLPALSAVGKHAAQAACMIPCHSFALYAGLRVFPQFLTNYP
jgi:hypothetical protein